MRVEAVAHKKKILKYSRLCDGPRGGEGVSINDVENTSSRLAVRHTHDSRARARVCVKLSVVATAFASHIIIIYVVRGVTPTTSSRRLRWCSWRDDDTTDEGGKMNILGNALTLINHCVIRLLRLYVECICVCIEV